ncbi:TolB family protein [Thiothrix nivea]|uniref:Uncharacterized protein n=1 Tax=Thiothrix nivea (strain ATCC 35100 / DSM 5205 / JP2) TaxID=870187 RepID=A0A656HDF8_THINJ|nr:PD40 domain-containing protein [Thiothrix nivea]EIJ34222.1 hypothetical protein Thini_1628 [Thiothrix nivea DSM 5205]
MSSYNVLERGIARLLGYFPAAKKFSKFSYSHLMYLIYKKSFKHQSIADPVAYTPNQQSSFFGYYDKAPESSKGVILAQIFANSTHKKPSAQKGIELVVFDKQKKPLLHIPICAYNWQQGCRAHWLSNDLFIFNDFNHSKNSYVARVYSLATQQQVKTFDHPVQDSFKTDYFISLNYRRLMALRPDYGYRNLPSLEKEQLSDLQNDGLWRIEYATGEAKLLISLADACKVNPHPEFENATHKFNHVMISPDGTQFIFLHRYLLGKRRVDRLMLADSKTGVLKLLSDYGMVSHCFWADDKIILAYMRGPENKDAYWLLDITTKTFTHFPYLESYGDGHPHVHGDWFVTDTYPDKARMQHLLLANWKTSEVKKLGEFFHGFEFNGETRCDLHPRFSPDGKTVYFDSVFSGKRQLYAMGIDY